MTDGTGVVESTDGKPPAAGPADQDPAGSAGPDPDGAVARLIAEARWRDERRQAELDATEWSTGA